MGKRQKVEDIAGVLEFEGRTAEDAVPPTRRGTEARFGLASVRGSPQRERHGALECAVRKGGEGESARLLRLYLKMCMGSEIPFIIVGFNSLMWTSRPNPTIRTDSDINTCPAVAY
jgi:hypothetical protein